MHEVSQNPWMLCVLCMKERLEILRRWKSNKNKLINDKHEMFGPCQCKTRFHRFYRTTASTDDGLVPERVDVGEDILCSVIDDIIEERDCDSDENVTVTSQITV